MLLTKAETEKRSLTEDEAKQFDTLNTEITRYEALSDEERSQVKTQPTSETLSNDELRHYLLTGETRALSTGVPLDGGYMFWMHRYSSSADYDVNFFSLIGKNNFFIIISH
ncbi:hypothetical protein [Xenorhabdus beddingii]|uniref:hypothetical protein n=1 Tax=Xenorhabdus beddingii TaxID=40578 RepID=UPI003BB5F5C4